MPLQGKVACITGAGHSIGQAIAARFASEGATLLLNDSLHADTLSHFLNDLRASAQKANIIDGDVTSELSIKSMVEGILQSHGHIDIWVNAASAAHFTASLQQQICSTEVSLEEEEQHFRRLLDVDVKGTFICCNIVAPTMQSQGGGSIINMSWDAALAEGTAGADSIMFAAAKGAVHSLSMSLARQYAPSVRVNVIAPGNMNEGTLYPPPTDQSPLTRFCTPTDIAEVALYLASHSSSYITGQTIVVNGGSIKY